MDAENIRITFSEDGEIACVMDFKRIDGDIVQCIYERADIIYAPGVISACVIALACACNVHSDYVGNPLRELVSQLAVRWEENNGGRPF